MATGLKSLVSRSSGKVVKAQGDKKRFESGAQEFGPFSVYFCAHHKKEKDGTFTPTGELGVKLEIGDSWPKTQIGFNHEGAGPLATIAENLDAFMEAVSAAVAKWGDDAAFSAAAGELDAYLKARKPAAEQPAAEQPAASGLVGRVKSRAAG